MNAADARRVAVFLAIGGSSFVLDVLVVGGLKALGVPPAFGRIAAFGTGLVWTWALNRRFTFQTQEPPTWREFAGFAAANAVGIGINFAVFSLALWLQAPWIAAMAAGTLVGAVWNFLAYRKVLGSKPEAASARRSEPPSGGAGPG